jgi:hypothetical protein
VKIVLYKRLLEGVDWKKNDDGTISLSVNQDRSDAANKGMNSVDTRVFGKKDEILFGDNTASGKNPTLYDTAKTKEATVNFYKDLITYVNNGKKGQIKASEYVAPQTIAAVKKWFEENKSDNFIVYAAKKAITRIEKEADVYTTTVDRIGKSDSVKIARYMTGKISGTNVKYIALFSMTDFNFSDAIKHGNIRQNGNTDTILGISPEDRKNTHRKTELAHIGVRYDQGVDPNIQGNFSISDAEKDHERSSYGVGDKKYTSVAQFMDKSVQYAAYVLNQEKFYPDFIVSPPSSSKFNEFYCTNLSRKLNVPYIKDFFMRNLINVRFDKDKDVSQMREDGFSEKDIMEFEGQVKSLAYKEISYVVSEPMRNFIESNKNLFGNISLTLHSREKTPIEDVFECMMVYAYKIITDKMKSSEDVVTKQLLSVFRSRTVKLYNKRYDFNHIIDQVMWVIKLKIGFKVFGNVLSQTYELVRKYSDQLKKQGYELKFTAKKAKLTSFKKQFRPYLHDVYIVADNYLGKDNKLTKQYKNAKFLIFDEDINSGATFKLCIDALQDKIPDNVDSNILCMANAYSAKGW